MTLLLPFAFAAELTVTRSPSAVEKAEPKEPKGMASDAAMEAYDNAMRAWRLATDAIARTDKVMQRDLPAVAACWGKSGDASFKIVLSERAIVSRVSGLKGGDAALQTCLDQTYKGQQFAAFTTSGDVELLWQVHFEPPAATPPVSPTERDLGIGTAAFGSPVADLGSSMQTTSSDYDTTYVREMDSGVKWCGETITRTSYLYTKNDSFYAAIFEVVGDNGAFNLRNALKSRYGQPKWDPAVRAWYWRGSHLLIVAHDLAGEPGVVVSVFDHVRAKSDAGISGLPGDIVDPTQTTTRLPAIFKH